jgi:UDP-3-O-[3-hydroxymyristoyl] glucosamine N-acyltransferase
MLLSELPGQRRLTMVRDADFKNLGFLFDALPRKLIFVESGRFLSQVRRAGDVACILTNPALAGMLPETPGLAVSVNPRLEFFEIQRFLVAETHFYGPSRPSEIHRTCLVHPRAWVAESNVNIGPGSSIGPNVVIHEGTTIGARVRIQAGAMLGAEGFQTARHDGDLVQMVHAGGVLIEDDVEIFANAVIARAVFRQRTTVGRFSRIGNGAFISHNVQIGVRTFVGHGAVVNGNTSLGDDVWIGPNATISNLLTISSGARISLGSTVIESVNADAHLTGPVAIQHRKALRQVASES